MNDDDAPAPGGTDLAPLKEPEPVPRRTARPAGTSTPPEPFGCHWATPRTWP
ncbi:hypothetical protein [Streptomyces sp. NPDC018584]|uniref:hypothetical protein n=1 Tax=unclassified Streptomyces TaxID=2593676 RepID=UPI0037B059DE